LGLGLDKGGEQEGQDFDGIVVDRIHDIGRVHVGDIGGIVDIEALLALLALLGDRGTPEGL
jgi:hypothetical protein